MTTMKVVLLENHGNEFHVTDLPRPIPGKGEVLVRIAASGVNPLDTKIRSGNAAHAKHPLPAILGIDLAGTVEQLGPDVSSFKVGDEVYGMAGGVGGIQGSLAQYAAVDARLLARKPSNLSMREAAALPLTFITAWEGLIDRINLQAGKKVLVIGAGGVGQSVIQIARSRGADVYAVDSAAKATLIRNLGATPIDYNSQTPDEYLEIYTGKKGFDVVYDTIGGAGLDTAFAVVARNGHVTSCLGWGSHALAPLSFKAATYSGVFTLLPLQTAEDRARHGAILREATKLAESGQLSVRLYPHEFNMHEVFEAHQIVEKGKADGKLVINID